MMTATLASVCGIRVSFRAASSTHTGRKEYRSARCADVRDPFAGDVVRGSMRRRTDWKWKTAHQRDATIEAHQLHRDLFLIVIHRDDGVEAALLRTDEHGVRRKRSVDIDPFASCDFHGGRDHVDLLAAEVAAVAR